MGGTTLRPIRPPDPAIVGTTLAYMPIASHEATRRLVHLAFRDAHIALDLTHAAGNFWRGPLPPGLRLTTNNLDPDAGADLHLDFTRTGLPDGSFDLAIYDPPHVADGGERSIMARRFGTVRGAPALRALIEAGVREAWRISSVGLIVKVADHAHGGEWLALSDWVKAAVPVAPYVVMHTTRPGYLRDRQAPRGAGPALQRRGLAGVPTGRPPSPRLRRAVRPAGRAVTARLGSVLRDL